MIRVILHKWADGQMIFLRMHLTRVMFYEAIRYDKININRGGEGVVVTRNLRYPEGTHTSTNRHVGCAAGRVHFHTPGA